MEYLRFDQLEHPGQVLHRFEGLRATPTYPRALPLLCKAIELPPGEALAVLPSMHRRTEKGHKDRVDLLGNAKAGPR